MTFGMSRPALIDTLKQLHTGLHAHHALSPAERAMLQTVLHDIERALDAEEPHSHDTVERLETAAVSFETRHPELSALTRQVIAAIRGAGI
jgi:hypothetical protein